MKSLEKLKDLKKHTYSKPKIERIKLDNEISIFMVSVLPSGDSPNESIQSEHFSENPFKMPNL